MMRADSRKLEEFAPCDHCSRPFALWRAARQDGAPSVDFQPSIALDSRMILLCQATLPELPAKNTNF